MRRLAAGVLIALFPLPLAAGALWFALAGWPPGWHQADWSSAGIAPDPRVNRGAIVQVYAARAGRWRSIFAVHTWVLVKPAGATAFTRYEVVGWGTPVRRNAFPPDGRWFSNMPRVVYDLRGPRAQELIPKIEAAVRAYPYRQAGSYRIWPGPNSNSFVATLARDLPDFNPVLPAVALGKDFIADGLRVGPAPSNTGWQVSAYGLLGVTLAREEGFELNILGLVAGLDLAHFAIKLPSFGEIGFGAPPVYASEGDPSVSPGGW